MNRNARLKELRKALDLSQERLGEKIGLTKSGISNIENGSRTLSDKHIKLICAAFPYVNEQWLQFGSGDMFIEKDENIISRLSDELGLGSKEIVFLKTYLALPPEHKQTLERFADFLKAQADRDKIETADEFNVDEEVERYRNELLIEKKVKTLSAYEDIKDA